jgi:MOSC domain-containing protein YiiM
MHTGNDENTLTNSPSGKIVAVCLSEERGTAKRSIGAGYFRKDYGLVGDAHAGSDKQVSLLALEDIEKVCAEKRIEAGPGDFAENITTSGVDLVSLPLGARLRLGEAIVKVTRIGKEKHLVHTYSYKGVSILPQRGAFASVEKSGHIKAGDRITVIS